MALTVSTSGNVTTFTGSNQVGDGLSDTTFGGTGQKIGFMGATPVAQVTQPGTHDVHCPAAGSTTAVYTNTTFDGTTGSSAYTIGDIVKALKAYGLLAS